ncbi:hypothetical protein BH09ACT3_BH09ACT3_06210 [soil metagenome]
MSYLPPPPESQAVQPAPPHAYPAQPLYSSPPARPTNSLAIVAFVLGFFVSLGAVICGHLALSQIKRSGEGGRGFAIAGLVLGYVGIGFTVIVIAIYAVLFFAIFATAGAASYMNA